MSTPENSPRARRALRFIVILVLLAAVATGVWYFLLRRPVHSNSVISVSGRIEGDDSGVAAKTAGKIHQILVREGDVVHAGQLIATIEDDQIAAREKQSQAGVDQSTARVTRAQQQIAVLQEQLDQSRIGVGQAREDAQGKVSQAEAQVAAAEAQLSQAQAAYNLAQYDAERYSTLAEQGDVSERSQRQAISTAEVQAATVRSARKQVDAARGALTAARANLANPAVRMSQSAAIQKQMQQAQSDIDAAQADADRARAQFKEAQANRADLQIVAPFDGTVTTRSVEPGEVVAAGTPVVTIVDLTRVYLRGFIPEDQIAAIHVGQPARVYLDAAPDKPVEATVERVDPSASFTPENTYFKNDRVKQVFGVKLRIVDAQQAAKPGMPADGEVLINGNTWPSPQRVNK